jgi:signal peptidase II
VSIGPEQSATCEPMIKANQSRRDWRGWLLALSTLILWTDRLTKRWVEKHIPVGGGITVIPHTFRLSHVYNSGAAFSLFGDSASPQRVRWFLISFSLLAAVLVFVFLMRLGRRITPASVALALILGGAIGNSFDRIHYGYVIDFLYVQLHWGSWHYHWPDFNVADSSIVVGGILLMIDAFRSTRES